jgi:hypothetical protein
MISEVGGIVSQYWEIVSQGSAMISLISVIVPQIMEMSSEVTFFVSAGWGMMPLVRELVLLPGFILQRARETIRQI